MGEGAELLEVGEEGGHDPSTRGGPSHNSKRARASLPANVPAFSLPAPR